ncbi:MAG: hypothetical protein DMF78_08630 [Acidobacteria bacterium]|nr:MAG: hypothetical protein DMF78_08630 [Acidobacteriota bacterium]
MPVLHLQAQAEAVLVGREVAQERDQTVPRELPREHRVHADVGVVELRVEQDQQAQGERGQHDQDQRARGGRRRDIERVPRPSPACHQRGQQRDACVHEDAFTHDALGRDHVPPDAGARGGGDRCRVDDGCAQRRAAPPRRSKGEEHDRSDRQPRGAQQREARAGSGTLDGEPIHRDAERPCIRGGGVDGEEERRAAFQPRQVDVDGPISYLGIGLDIEDGDRPPLDPHRNSSGLNEMSAHSRVQAPSLAADRDGKPHGRGPSRPMETREPLALPVLAEPAHVVRVVGAEVEEHGPRVARRRLRQCHGQSGEEDEGGSCRERDTGDLARSARRRRHVPYVTSTAA